MMRHALALAVALMSPAAYAGAPMTEAPVGRFGAHPPAGEPDPYIGLKQRSGASCCSAADCRETVWRPVKGGAEIKIEGRWCPVDPDKVLPTGLPDGQAHICGPQPAPGTDPCLTAVFCIIAGGAT